MLGVVFFLILFLRPIFGGDIRCSDVLLGQSQIPRFKFSVENQYLFIEILEDGMIHFEFSDSSNPGPDLNKPLYSSPLIIQRDFSGPVHIQQNDFYIETSRLKIFIEPKNLCMGIEDRVKGVLLTTICPDKLNESWKELALEPRTITHVYGLGQHFKNPGTADGNWVGEVFEPGEQGNMMRWFHGGAPSVSQFPVMYALGSQNENYMLFLDQFYKTRWDFKQNWWRVGMWGDQIRGYFIVEDKIPDLHRKWIGLVGKPILPPKNILGLWMSEFGYENWEETDDILRSLRKNHFPIDGFLMDIQWFGGKFNGDQAQSRMGTLQFDEAQFPNPQRKILEYRNNEGISLGVIEEPYIAENLKEHWELERRGFLAKEFPGGWATRISHNPWWGMGGILDITNPNAGDFWHDLKRKPLIDLGIHVHWADLLEPEMYNSWATYYGIPELGKTRHADIHNLYALLYLESIHRGYLRNQTPWRGFSLSRSGTVGIHRYGGMWSGDIGANMGSLTAHYQARMHLSLLGMNFYSSDIGGFHPWHLDGDRNQLFTQWFANACLLDIPIRPHVWNLDNRFPTAPDRVGHLESNRDNLRLRYQLAPYLYSLVHESHRTGTPLLPPLVYYYQDDPNVRNLGNEVHIGPSLLAGITASYGETSRNIYLPAHSGTWVDFYTNEFLKVEGNAYNDVPIYRDGKLKIPLFAKTGAIIPMATIDEKTMNMLGKRSDGSARSELRARVYASPLTSQFTLIEDDGETNGYKNGEISETDISQVQNGNKVYIKISGARGKFTNLFDQRNIALELVVDEFKANQVAINGEKLKSSSSDVELNQERAGFLNYGQNLILMKSGLRGVHEDLIFEIDLAPNTAKTTSVLFVCEGGNTVPGESMYVVGSIPELGNWEPKLSVKLDAMPYPTWTRLIENIPKGVSFEWKCLKKNDETQSVLKLGEGSNISFSASQEMYSGKTVSKFS